jgi:hypothetical protein
VFGYPYASADNNQTIDKWQQAFTPPTPRRPFAWTQPTYTTIAYPPVTIGWFQALSTATPRRPVNWTQPVFVTVNFDNNLVGMGWYQPFPVTLNIGWPQKTYLRGGQPFVPREATFEAPARVAWLQAFRGPPRIKPRHTTPGYTPRVIPATPNTITGMAWHQPLARMPRVRPPKTQAIYPVRTIVIPPNTITGIPWFQGFRGPPRIKPRVTQPIGGRTIYTIFPQTVSANIEVTVTFHMCGWGTEAEVVDASAPQDERTDVWSEQVEQVDVAVVETEQSDPWSEQAERDDEFDEKDECGR